MGVCKPAGEKMVSEEQNDSLCSGVVLARADQLGSVQLLSLRE